jgi:DNA-binding winged helix-turn-helix (wHTH) protein
MVTIRVLGPLEVVDAAGAAVVLPPRARRLLAALVTRANQVASTDWLIDAVYAGDPPLAPEAALQTLISRLRNVLRRVEQGVGKVVVSRR